MSTFIMLTRLAHGALRDPSQLETLERQVKDRVAAECDGVEWIESYAVLGPYDYVDIFRAPDNDTAIKVATIIRTYGHAHTEVWPAAEWRRYKEMVQGLPTAP